MFFTFYVERIKVRKIIRKQRSYNQKKANHHGSLVWEVKRKLNGGGGTFSSKGQRNRL